HPRSRPCRGLAPTYAAQGGPEAAGAGVQVRRGGRRAGGAVLPADELRGLGAREGPDAGRRGAAPSLLRGCRRRVPRRRDRRVDQGRRRHPLHDRFPEAGRRV
ncbi:MAG: hypothetical protein AVDCRST_MAG59-3482, partial [uncultured Thermomicrobiales bacterium]